MALTTSILEATAAAETSEGRVAFAESMAPVNYLNQPVEILKQILTGVFPLKEYTLCVTKTLAN